MAVRSRAGQQRLAIDLAVGGERKSRRRCAARSGPCAAGAGRAGRCEAPPPDRRGRRPEKPPGRRPSRRAPARRRRPPPRRRRSRGGAPRPPPARRGDRGPSPGCPAAQVEESSFAVGHGLIAGEIPAVVIEVGRISAPSARRRRGSRAPAGRRRSPARPPSRAAPAPARRRAPAAASRGRAARSRRCRAPQGFAPPGSKRWCEQETAASVGP